MSNMDPRFLTLRDSRRVVKLMLEDVLRETGHEVVSFFGISINVRDKLNPEIDKLGEYQTGELLKKWSERIDTYRSGRSQVEDSPDH